MPRRPILIGLERSETNKLVEFLNQCARSSKMRMRRRGQAVYLSHEGKRVGEIAHQLLCSKNAVYRWLKQYKEKGIAGLSEPTHSARLTNEQLDQIMEVGHWAKPASGQKEGHGALIKRIQDRWSFRKMANWANDNLAIKISHARLRQMVLHRLREE